MSNKIDIEIEGAKHSLLFGMTCVNIMQEKTIELTKLKGVSELNSWEIFFCIIYGGLCNYADKSLTNRPTWDESYEITEQIGYDDELQKKIYLAFEESEPTKFMLERLNGKQKKKETIK